jgi:transposase
MEPLNIPSSDSETPSIIDLLATVDSLSFEIKPILHEAYCGIRGRPPYDPLYMFKAVLYRTRTQSLRQLCKELKSNKHLLQLTGLPRVPTHQTFSIFINRIGEDRDRRISEIVIRELRKYWPDFGNIISIDGTVVKAYAKRNRGYWSSSDKDARLGYKDHRSGKPIFEFGYRTIIATDAKHEIPIASITKPAKANESPIYLPILKQIKNIKIPFEVVIADAQYDSNKNIWATITYGAKPIIPLNPRSSEKVKQTGKRRGDFYLPIQRNSQQWKQYLAMRSSSERLNSILKKHLGLESLKVRGLKRVSTFFTICIIARQLQALTAARLVRNDLSRSVLVWCY